MSKLSEHLSTVIALLEQIGTDAEQVAERFAGDVEGHLRVVESHLMQIINSVKADTPTPPTEPAPTPAEPEPAASAAGDDSVAEVPAPSDPAAATANAEAGAEKATAARRKS